MKALTQKWAPVLDSDIGPKIVHKEDSEIIAQLLENTTLLVKGYLPEHLNITPDCKLFQQYALPLTRRYYFSNLSTKIATIFQTKAPAGEYNFLRYNDISDDFQKLEGSVLVGIREIETPSLSDFLNDGFSEKNDKVLNLSMEKAIYEYNSNIDNELVSAITYCASNRALGGSLDISDSNLNDMDIVNHLFERANDIEQKTHVKEPNLFVICSKSVADIVSKSKHFSEIKQTQMSRYIDIGTLSYNSKIMLVIQDTVINDTEPLYSIVGIKGEPGHSGIGFMPYLPFIFTSSTKSADNPTDKKVMIKTRYAIISNIINSGSFYKYDRYHFGPVSKVIEKAKEQVETKLTLEEGLFMLSSKALLEIRDSIAKPTTVYGSDKIWLDLINKELQSRDKTDETYNDM